jgi:tetratricopeptide (TPR) repeat protein
MSYLEFMAKENFVASTAVSIFMLVSLLQPAWADKSFMAQAQEFVDSKNFEQASRCYGLELKQNPNNSGAHYLLGRTMLRLKHTELAIPEFEAAERLDPKGPAGKYSLQYLQSIKGTPNTVSKTEPPDKTEDQSGVIHAAKKIGKDMSQASTDLSAEQEIEIKRVEQKGDEQIAWRTRQMQAKLAENAGVNPKYVSAQQTQAIKTQYDSDILMLRAEVEKERDSVKELYRAKQAAIEESAAGLHKAYESKNQSGKIMLSPLGTNLHVRSYQTSDEPSGNEVPVLGTPGRLPKKP